MLNKYIIIAVFAGLLTTIIYKQNFNKKKLVSIVGTQNLLDITTKNKTFVKYYVPWCGYCKIVEPIWNEFAKKKNKSNVVIAQVDCDNILNKDLCKNQNIKGFPTFILYDKNSKGNGVRYNGERNADNFQNFLK